MSQSYDVGTRAWQPDVTEGWVASEVVKKTINGAKVTLEFKLENGEVRYKLANAGLDASQNLHPKQQLAAC